MSPPSFEEAKNKRQKVRAAGLDPNYWYAVEYDRVVKKKQVVEVKFWGSSVALYRDDRGDLHAIENRCAHRQLKLSLGQVVGDRLVCSYHGWEFAGSGKLAAVPHDTFGHKIPNCKLKSFAVRVRYGLIWIFFGDQDRAWSTPMPEIPELEGPDAWACVPVDATWKAHHSMILDNVSDFTHAHLHQRFKPFSNDSKLTKLETVGDKVFLAYATQVGRGQISGLFIDRKSIDTTSMELCYDYPYQRSNTDDHIKHWLFVLPIDEHTTRAFFLFHFKKFKVPFLPIRIPQRLMKPILQISNKVMIGPLLDEDGMAVEAEQEGWERHYDEPIAELSPAVHHFQALTIRKWEEHLARQKQPKLVEPQSLVRNASGSNASGSNASGSNASGSNASGGNGNASNGNGTASNGSNSNSNGSTPSVNDASVKAPTETTARSSS